MEPQTLKPGINPETGELFQVYLPTRGRNILPEGEPLALDSYISRRILDGELVREAPQVKPSKTIKTTEPTA